MNDILTEEECLGLLTDRFADVAWSFTCGPAEVLLLDRLVRSAASTVVGVQHAALSMTSSSGHLVTVAATSEVPRTIDDIQSGTGQGPSQQMLADADLVHIRDLATDNRWPLFAERVVTQTGVRAMFSIRLRHNRTQRVALNFYTDRPNSFTDLDLDTGIIYASFAAAALHVEDPAFTIDHLNTARAFGREIGIALSILMLGKLLTRERAFDQLRNASWHLHHQRHTATHHGPT